jgi:hypothetical protein
MQSRATSEASHFLLLGPPYLHPKGVERLRLIPADVGPSNPLTADGAIACLREAGLACENARRPLHIHGGTAPFVDRDIRGYENAFVILAQEGEQFLAIVSGVGGHQHDEEVTTSTLTEAVDAVISIYRRRGALTSPGRSK